MINDTPIMNHDSYKSCFQKTNQSSNPQDYQNINNMIHDVCKSLTDTNDGPELSCCKPKSCEESILCSQAMMSKCEAHLFCEATSRLSYELCKARTLYDVKQVIDSINCLYSSSSLKLSSLAEFLEAYSKVKYRPITNCDCCFESK